MLRLQRRSLKKKKSTLFCEKQGEDGGGAIWRQAGTSLRVPAAARRSSPVLSGNSNCAGISRLGPLEEEEAAAEEEMCVEMIHVESHSRGRRVNIYCKYSPRCERTENNALDRICCHIMTWLLLPAGLCLISPCCLRTSLPLFPLPPPPPPPFAAEKGF